MPRLSLAVLAALLLLPGTAAGENTRLFATVGPGFSIGMADGNGGRVLNLPAGTYDIVVRDQSDEHNFHLTGPGVDRATDVDFIGQETWTVTIRDGTYTFVCDPHFSSMRGRFTVGAQPPPAPPPAATRLNASVGPGFAISLRTTAGKAVRSAKAGQFRITVRDRSRAHNFHLVGPGVNRKTAVRATGTSTWSLRLRAGTYRFVCDPHRTRLKGSFRVG